MGFLNFSGAYGNKIILGFVRWIVGIMGRTEQTKVQRYIQSPRWLRSSSNFGLLHHKA